VFGKTNTTALMLIVGFCSSVYGSALDLHHDNKSRQILSCTRVINSKVGFVHCYLKFVRGPNILDSRGFFDEGSMQEPAQFVHTGNCVIVSNDASEDDWVKITDTYGKYSNQDYHILNRNCCTVAKEAIEAMRCVIPSNIKNANSSIGTGVRS